MTDRESSVMVSLGELLRMEEQRKVDVAEAERARVAAAERQRLEEENARLEAAESRARDEDARRRDRELRDAVQAAQIEAQKALEIEKTILETRVRNYADQLAARDAHARELQAMLDAQHAGGRKGTVVATVLAALATIVAVVAVSFAMRTPPQPVASAPTPIDNGAELEATKRKIGELEKQILGLKDLKDLDGEKPVAAPTVPTVVKPKPQPVPKPLTPTGTICPPGQKGVPMCP